ncbi:MAG: helix-turn-helix domain-containing protein [Fimbriimonas sp.]
MRLRTFGGDPEVVKIVTGSFNSRPGYRVVRPDGTSSWLITLTLGGEGRLGEMRTRPGELVLIRPRTPHDYGVPEGGDRWEFIWAHFRPPAHWMPWLGGEAMRSSVADDRTRMRFMEMHRFAPEAMGEDLALNALEEVLIRTAVREPGPVWDSRIAVVTSRVRAAVDHPWDTAELARLVGISPSRLAHLFREQTGEAIGRFIERQRVERAQRLLETSALSVTQIATACGFPNVYYFSKRFKHSVGETPTGYRRRIAVRA